MRKLCEKFEEKFENELKPIIDFVKNNEDVFFGIRNNYIDLYVDGGCFLELKYNKKNIIAKIDEQYFDNCSKRMPEILKQINKQPIENLNDWMTILGDLKAVVSDYQNKKIKEITTKKREKILQQKLVREFNENSKYFAYDIEYVIEGLNDYVYDTNMVKTNKKPKTLGRADIMLISKPIDNKIKVYFMEVKEGTGAFGGVLSNLSTDKYAPSFGSGLVGHLKNNVAIINSARKNVPYISKYREERHKKDEKEKYEFDIRGDLLEEIKYSLHFYTKFELMKNKNFMIKEEDIEKLNISNEEDAIELVFFLGNHKENGSFENHLGIGNGVHSKYSVKALLDNKMKEEINLDYISYEALFDFKVVKEPKSCDDNGFNLEIEDKYYTIHKEEFNG